MRKRFFAMFLALCMLASSIPTVAFAAEADEHQHNADGWVCEFAETGRELICEQEEHEHTEECYTPAEPELVCAVEEHTHAETCTYDSDGNPTCGKEKHTHGEECYAKADPVLTCELSEHIHTDDCYEVTGEWSCTPPQEEESAQKAPFVFMDAGEDVVGAKPLTAGTLASGVYILNGDLQGDVVIEDGRHVVIDLNGYTLTGSGEGSVIVNHGVLTITDNSSTKTGTITGGNVQNMDANPESALLGGGISNFGILTLNDGSISGNKSYYGGGVNNCGYFEMNGGQIYDNEGEYFGGGVRVYFNATFSMQGGRIHDNLSHIAGGGVSLLPYSAFYKSEGTKIYNNIIDPEYMDGHYGYGRDVSFGGGAEDPGSDHPTSAYLAVKWPSTWGIIGMDNWYYDSPSCVYPDLVMPMNPEYVDANGNGLVDFTVGKVVAVLFDAAGGVWDDGTVSDKDVLLWVDETGPVDRYFSIDDDRGLMPDDPQRPGYTFEGWFSKPDGQGDKLDTAALVNSNEKYYAQWEKSEKTQFTLTYQSNGGSYVPMEVHDAGETIYLTAVPDLDGYEFAGWYGDESLTQKITQVTMDKDQTVYAGWIPSSFPEQHVKVTFDPNGGSLEIGGISSVDVLMGAAISPNQFPEDPSREGYRFLGWYTSATAGTKFEPYTTVTRNTHVYAHWEQLQPVDPTPQYELVYVTNGGTPQPETRFYDVGTDVSLETKITRAGYTFGGWFLDDSFTGESVSSVKMNAKTYVYAKWTKDSAVDRVDITYHFVGEVPEGATLPGPHNVDKSKSYIAYQYTESEIPRGWTFDGWYADRFCTYKVTSFVPVTTYETIKDLYGRWYRGVTVTFDPNGGSWDEQDDVQLRAVREGDELRESDETGASEEQKMPSNPTKEGWTFLGWNTEPDGSGQAFGAYVPVMNDITVYAQWKQGDWITVRYRWDTTRTELIPSDVDLPKPELIRRNTAYVARPVSVSNQGLRFDGWYTDKNCTSTFADGTVLNEDTVLTGAWLEDAFTLTYVVPGYEDKLTCTFSDYRMGYMVPFPSLDDYFENYINDEQAEELFDEIIQSSVLIGWRDTVSGVVHSVSSANGLMPPRDLTLQAVLEPKTADTKYTLTYNYMDYYSAEYSKVEFEFHDAGDTVSLKTGDWRNGYTLCGWTDTEYELGDEESTTPTVEYAPGASFNMPDDDVTLYAIWDKNEEVSTLLRFKTYGGAPVPDQYLVDWNAVVAPADGSEGKQPYYFRDANGGAVTFPDPHLAGFEFVGWYFPFYETLLSMDGPDDTKVYFQTMLEDADRWVGVLRKEISSGNYQGKTLLEKRRELATMVFSTKGRYIVAPEEYFSENVFNNNLLGFDAMYYNAYLCGNGPDKPVVSLLANGTLLDNDVCDVWDTLSTSVEMGFEIPEEVTLHAIYRKGVDLMFPANLTYVANDGSNKTHNCEFIETATVKVEENMFENGDRIFSSWNTKADGTGATYRPGDDFTVPADGATLYAQWKDASRFITVTYQLVDGSGNELAEVPPRITVPAPRRIPVGTPYYSEVARPYPGFDCWFTEPSCQNLFEDGTELTEDTILYGRWIDPATMCIVTYDKNGGDTDADPRQMNVASGSSVGVLPSEPTRAGYTFLGWNTAPSGDGEAFNAATTVITNITVYAQWAKNDSGDPDPEDTYTITYTDGVEDEVVFEDQVTAGLKSGASTPAFEGTPTRSGYQFKGWSPEVAETVTASVTYTSQWEPQGTTSPDPDKPGGGSGEDDDRPSRPEDPDSQKPNPDKPVPEPTEPSQPATPAKPGETDGKDIPQTGDNSNMSLWIVLASLSLFGMAATLFGRKRLGRRGK